jgi:hypothetical protein
VSSTIARIVAPFKAEKKQQLAAKHWRDPAVRVVTIGGAIRSGKTQAGGRLIVETADPGVTWKHYARLFDRSDVEARVRAAQASLGAP